MSVYRYTYLGFCPSSFRPVTNHSAPGCWKGNLGAQKSLDFTKRNKAPHGRLGWLQGQLLGKNASQLLPSRPALLTHLSGNWWLTAAVSWFYLFLASHCYLEKRSQDNDSIRFIHVTGIWALIMNQIPFYEPGFNTEQDRQVHLLFL